MNEFIVWDNYEEEFICDEDIAINSHGTIFECNPDAEVFNVLSDGMNRYLKLDYIGKTDIEGNKIYADCSILNIIDCEDAIYKVTWNDESLKYQIERISPDDGDWLISDFDEMDSEDLEVIGTLQQDKHLLGEEDAN